MAPCISSYVVFVKGSGEITGGVLASWVWLLVPYVVGAVILFGLSKPTVALGWLVLPVIVDTVIYDGVFVHPSSSTDAIAYAFSPAWNSFLFAATGRRSWVGSSGAGANNAAKAPSNNALERERGR